MSGGAGVLDFMDLFVFVGTQLTDQSERYFEIVKDPFFVLMKEVILAVVELVLLFVARSFDIPGATICFNKCMTRYGDKYDRNGDIQRQKCTKLPHTPNCLQECDWTESKCLASAAYSDVWLTAILSKIIIIWVWLGTWVIIWITMRCIGRTMKSYYEQCGCQSCGGYDKVFSWIMLFYNFCFGFLAFLGSWLFVAAGGTGVSAVVLVVISNIDFFLTLASYVYAYMRCCSPKKDDDVELRSSSGTKTA
eukprot:TRINITY_DN3509_c0_g1_i1.p1 TRINITY_DN3509_c0_g1~~TRINITY_DN3509_c0_g1_i1.p1  ORF type:complete len:249 (+),score=39.93 TRINITY_DN3509_c0_g1_i1:64-810(+)